MSAPVWVDTSAFAAAANRHEGERHDRAVAEFQRLAETGLRLECSSHIFSETVTLIRRRAGHSTAVAFLDGFSTARVLHIVRPSRQEEDAALSLFRRYRDLEFSHCDCVTAAMMNARRTREIFTFDQDFRILGFRTLPE